MFIKRLLSFVYDLLLLWAVVIVSFALLYIPVSLLSGLEEFGNHPLVKLYLLFVIVWFHLWFWHKDGQTLGMKSWRLKLVRDDEKPITWPDVIRRYLAGLLSLSCLGLGFIWILVDPEGKAWHDRLSSTHLILIPKS